ncbi:MAG: hypothetical protein AB7U73_18555 [Pirellulales bacterium]
MATHLYRYADEMPEDHRRTLSQHGLWRLDEILPGAVADLLATMDESPPAAVATVGLNVSPLVGIMRDGTAAMLDSAALVGSGDAL